MPYKKYEDQLASNRRSYEKNKNKEKNILRRKKYREDHKKELASYYAKYQKDRRDLINKRARERRKTDPEYRAKQIEYSRLWRKNNPGKMAFMKKKSILKHTYGLTLEQYNEMVNRNGGRCYICNKIKKRNNCKNGLCVDHDHKTGQVRGLLCHSCNRALGLLGDDIKILKLAIKYLEKYA